MIHYNETVDTEIKEDYKMRRNMTINWENTAIHGAHARELECFEMRKPKGIKKFKLFLRRHGFWVNL